MITSDIYDENNDIYLHEMNENTIKSNIVFKLSNNSILPTYFDEDTPIDVIKAFVSGDNSLKDIKFTIQKGQNLDQNKINNNYSSIYHENIQQNPIETNLPSFKENSDQNVVSTNDINQVSVESTDNIPESDISKQKDPPLIENPVIEQLPLKPAPPKNINGNNQSEVTPRSHNNSKKERNSSLSSEKGKGRNSNLGSIPPKDESKATHGSRPNSNLRTTPNSTSQKDSAKNYNSASRSSTDQERPKSRNKIALTTEKSITQANSQKHPSRTEKPNTRPKSREKIKSPSETPKQQPSSKSSNSQKPAIIKSSAPKIFVPNNKNPSQPIIPAVRVITTDSPTSKTKTSFTSDHTKKHKKMVQNQNDSPDIQKIDDEIQNIHSGCFVSLEPQSPTASDQHKAKKQNDAALQQQKQKQQKTGTIQQENVTQTQKGREKSKEEKSKQTKAENRPKSKEDEKLRQIKEEAAPKSKEEKPVTPKEPNTVKQKTEKPNQIDESNETKATKSDKSSKSHNSSKQQMKDQPPINDQNANKEEDPNKAKEPNSTTQVQPIEEHKPVRPPEGPNNRPLSSQKRVTETIPVDFEKVQTMAQLSTLYNYEKGDVILIEYNRHDDTKSSKVEETEEDDDTFHVKFYPFVYDEKGSCQKYEPETVPTALLHNKTVRYIRNQLDIQFKSGQPITPFTHKFKQSISKSTRPSKFIPGVIKESDDKTVKEYTTILISNDCKIIDDNEIVIYKGEYESKPAKFDTKISSIFLIYVKSDTFNIDRIALDIEPQCVKLFEREKVNTSEIKIVDLYNTEKEIASIDVSNIDLNVFTVGQLYELTQKVIQKEIDDFSLFAERNESTVFLFNNDEIVQSIINETGESKFLYMNVLNKKNMLPRMLKNFKKMANEELDDDQLNRIFIHSGRSSDITISTIQFYA